MTGKEAETTSTPSSGRTSRWMVIALSIAAIVFVVRFIAPDTVGEQIRRHVEEKLREHYVGLDVSIGRGRLEPEIGLILEDIEIGSPQETRWPKGSIGDLVSAPSREMIKIQQLVIVASTDLQKLLDQENPFVSQRTIINGVSVRAWLDSDQRISLENLLPFPSFSERPCPRTEIRDVSLVLEGDSSQGQPLEAVISEAVILRHAISSVGSNHSSNAERITISARGAATFAEKFDVQVACQSGDYQIHADVSGGKLSKDYLARLPASIRQLLKPIDGLELLADSTIDVKMIEGQKPSFSAKTRIHDGQYRHPKSPIPLKGIRGLITCDASGVKIESCQAYWGDARLTVSGQTFGYAFPGQATLNMSASGLMLDRRLAAILPKRLEPAWEKFEPNGFIDIPRSTFKINGDKIETSAKVICKGVDLSYEKFPYPVRNVVGTVTVESGRAKSELISGRVGGQVMQCLFDIPTKTGSSDPRVVSFSMGGPLAIDNELIQACTPRGSERSKLEDFVRSLNPIGSIHVTGATFRTDKSGQKHKTIEMAIRDASLRYAKFPYPLYNVVGNIRVTDQELFLTDFHGANANGGVIRCSGRYELPPPDTTDVDTPRPQERVAAPPVLALDFDASNVALDEALRTSLPKASRDTWDNLSPGGVLDSLTIGLRQQQRGSKLDFDIVARQIDSQRIGTDALRIQPTAIPYRLDIVNALVRYRDGKVAIDSIHAQHGPAVVSAHGKCEPTQDGRWLLSINMHSGSRLIPDAELIAALPGDMQAALRGLNLRGPVGFRGLSETLLPNENHPDPVFVWDLVLQLEGNRIGDVGPVHSLRGEFLIAGRRDASGMQAGGEVRIDSMHINELQVTQLRGPYSIIDDRLRLGSITPDGAPAQPIGGRLFDGMMRLDGNVRLSDANFQVRLALDEAKVPVVLADLGHGKSNLTGTLGANMELEGLLGTTELLHGRGKATVDNANLYELPVLVQLLNVLSISPTEDVAFTNADIAFTLNEEDIRFDDLKLWGSLIALQGSGTMNRRHELDLSFNTRVSPRNTFTRIIRPLNNNRYTLFTVDVRGPLEDPTIERRALEGVGNTIEWLLPGFSGGTATNKKNRAASFGRMRQ